MGMGGASPTGFSTRLRSWVSEEDGERAGLGVSWGGCLQ